MNSSLSIKYTIKVIRDGSEIESVSGKNLILDAGMTDPGYLGASTPGNMINFARAGTGTGVNSRDSALITVSNNWTNSATPVTLTASSSFFVSADVGRIVKLNSGEELKVNTFTNGTTVVCDSYPTAISNTGQAVTVWYTNQTNLVTPISFYNSIGTGGGSPVATVDTGAATARIDTTWQFDSAASNASYTVTEFGWGRGSTLGSRIVLPSPLSLITGDIMRVTLSATITVDTSDKTISAGAFSGHTRFYGAPSDATGAAYIFDSYWPGVSNGFYLLLGNPDQSVIHNAPYTTGKTDIPTLPVPVSQANGTWTAISWGANAGTFITTSAVVHKFDTPVTKTNTQTLNVTNIRTVTRILAD